jgi:3-hydroxybutyrate dehydrogenase
VKQGMTREDALNDMLQIRQPSRRVVMPAEVAGFGLFLCSEAAANISGADLPIDGAWSVL